MPSPCFFKTTNSICSSAVNISPSHPEGPNSPVGQVHVAARVTFAVPMTMKLGADFSHAQVRICVPALLRTSACPSVLLHDFRLGAKACFCALAHIRRCVPAHIRTCVCAHLRTCGDAFLRTCSYAHLLTLTCAGAYLRCCAGAHIRSCAYCFMALFCGIRTCARAHLLNCARAQVRCCAGAHLLLLQHPLAITAQEMTVRR